MASTNKTLNYGLNRWVGTDPVLREDFNADNQRVDEVLAQQNQKVLRLQEGLRNQQYNMYGLLLNNHYEGRYTGMKRAMIVQAMDSYLDVQQADGCAVDVGRGYAWVGELAGTGHSTIDSDTDYVANSPRELNAPVYQQFELEGGWSLTGIQVKVCYLQLNVNALEQVIEVYAADENGAPAGTALASKTVSYTVDSSNAIRSPLATFDSPVTLTPGMYVVKSWFSSSQLTAATYLPYFAKGPVSDYSRACTEDGTVLEENYSFALGGSAEVICSDSGTLEMRPTEMNCSFDSVSGFFRHDGHVPGVEMSLDGGAVWTAMVPGETVALVGPDGRSSYETAYLLEEVSSGEAPEVSFRISMSRGSDGEARLYDYGVVFL